MDMSPNQYTERMRVPSGAHRSPFWEQLDAQLLAEEAQIAEQKAWLEHDSVPVGESQDPYGSLEAQLGHLMMFGKITAEQAYKLLGPLT